MKDYIRAKNKVNPPNRFRNIQTFLMWDGLRKLARMAAILDFFKIFNRYVYCPMKGYIRAKKEVMNKIYIERGRTSKIHNHKPDKKPMCDSQFRYIY